MSRRRCCDMMRAIARRRRSGKVGTGMRFRMSIRMVMSWCRWSMSVMMMARRRRRRMGRVVIAVGWSNTTIHFRITHLMGWVMMSCRRLMSHRSSALVGRVVVAVGCWNTWWLMMSCRRLMSHRSSALVPSPVTSLCLRRLLRSSVAHWRAMGRRSPVRIRLLGPHGSNKQQQPNCVLKKIDVQFWLITLSS